NGKPAVIKIILKRGIASNDNELKNWKIILDAKSQMTPEMQRHIPTIYALKSGKVSATYRDFYIDKEPDSHMYDGIYDEDDHEDFYEDDYVGYHAIIMEQLYKLPKVIE